MWLPHTARIPICWHRTCPVRLPLPIIPGFNPSDHRFGGFGVKNIPARCPGDFVRGSYSARAGRRQRTDGGGLEGVFNLFRHETTTIGGKDNLEYGGLDSGRKIESDHPDFSSNSR